ncbi:glycosyltransferase [Acidaminococcus fermentans]|uniref:glycosyltransferase n=1 Tax=Acidaminococcus fermentans TaxID=905 RepID=UPI003F8A5C81
MKLAGVVTLYHPGENVFTNINSYLDQLDILYVLDNTEKPNDKIKARFSGNAKIKYIAFHDNMGIAFAMNYALQAAKDYEFLLTMDQDSQFMPDMMATYKKAIEQFEKEHPKKIGEYAVNFDQRVDPIVSKPKYVNVAITSGSIISIQKSLEIGGFDENLFIDEVDNDFSYRIQKKGLKIIEFPFVILKHSLGKQTFHNILGFSFNTFNHNALRKYYITRNKIYMMKRYSGIRKQYMLELIKMIIKVILVEKNKGNKLEHIFMGCKDGIMNRMGKYLG